MASFRRQVSTDHDQGAKSFPPTVCCPWVDWNLVQKRILRDVQNLWLRMAVCQGQFFELGCPNCRDLQMQAQRVFKFSTGNMSHAPSLT